MVSDWIFKANKLSNPSPRVHTNMFTAVSETRLFTMKMVENFPSTGHWTIKWTGSELSVSLAILYDDLTRILMMILVILMTMMMVMMMMMMMMMMIRKEIFTHFIKSQFSG